MNIELFTVPVAGEVAHRCCHCSVKGMETLLYTLTLNHSLHKLYSMISTLINSIPCVNVFVEVRGPVLWSYHNSELLPLVLKYVSNPLNHTQSHLSEEVRVTRSTHGGSCGFFLERVFILRVYHNCYFRLWLVSVPER